MRGPSHSFGRGAGLSVGRLGAVAGGYTDYSTVLVGREGPRRVPEDRLDRPHRGSPGARSAPPRPTPVTRTRAWPAPPRVPSTDLLPEGRRPRLRFERLRPHIRISVS